MSSGNALRLLMARGAPSPPAVYPAGVVGNGIQTTWDTQTTAGLSGPTTKTLGIDTLPAGFTLIGDELVCPTSGGSTMSDWNLAGASLIFEGGTGTTTFNNCAINGPSRSLRLNRDSNGSSIAVFNDCDLNLVNANSGGETYESPIYAEAGSLWLNRCKIHDASRDHITFLGDSLNLSDCYMTLLGQRGEAGDHYEFIHIREGTLNLLRTFLDLRDGIGPGGVTGYFFPHQFPGPVDFSVIDCVLAGDAATFGMVYSVQYGDNIVGSMNNNAMNSGISAYVHVESPGVLSGSHNLDLDTAVLITDGGLT